MEAGGAIIYSGDSRWEKSLTMPRKPNRNPSDFYPQEEISSNHWGSAVIAVVVEADGRISWEAILKSSGHKGLDDAALKWAKSTRFKSPATLDSKPVRVFMVLSAGFNLVRG